MSKKILTTMIVLGALALGACQEEAAIDEMIDETELSKEVEPDMDADQDDIEF